MKKSLLLFFGLVAAAAPAVSAETVTLNDKEYEINTLIDYDLGPGVRYTRLRIPGYPLNVNMLRIDVTNRYNSVEVQQASEKLYSTESLVNGAKRNSSEGHVALAGANANFWCVTPQPPYSDYLTGMTYNGNLKNGKIITETNVKNDQWNGGIKHTGITGVTADNKVYSSNNFSWEGFVTSEATGRLEIYQCNKIVRDGELGLYNSFYPTSRSFRCFDQDGTKFVTVPNCATEVYLMLDKDSEWSAGNDITFTVSNIRTNAGDGSIGNYDLALVGRGDNATALARLKEGDKVTVNYSWIDPDGNRVQMTNLVGGNAQVLVNSELTKYNDSENYNSQVYSRTGYGTNADNTMMYVIVIDKATDPVYGLSAGCPTSVMCQIAMHYGCTDMTNFDAGGSAMMMVGDKIINKTTEGNPRAVANGMVVFSTAPADRTVARLEFYDMELISPVYGISVPRVIAYNGYGAVIDDNFTDFVLSCPDEAGYCEGNTFHAAGKGMVSELTASCNGVSVSKPVTIVDADIALRIKPVLIDLAREYPVEVTASVDGKTFYYEGSTIEWKVENPDIVSIDEKGVLRGIKEGTTKYSATIGEFTDETEVTVEAADGASLPLDGHAINADEWSISYSSTKNGTITPTGSDSGMGLDFAISSSRSPSISLKKNVTFYSLPDAIEITVNPGETSLKDIFVTVKPANGPASNYTHSETFATGKDNTVTITLDKYGDTSDLAFYPAVFTEIGFTVSGSSGQTPHFDIKSMKALYNNFAGVEGIIADGLYDDGAERVFDLKGIEVSADRLAPGMYIKVSGGKAEKIIVK